MDHSVLGSTYSFNKLMHLRKHIETFEYVCIKAKKDFPDRKQKLCELAAINSYPSRYAFQFHNLAFSISCAANVAKTIDI